MEVLLVYEADERVAFNEENGEDRELYSLVERDLEGKEGLEALLGVADVVAGQVQAVVAVQHLLA